MKKSPTAFVAYSKHAPLITVLAVAPASEQFEPSDYDSHAHRYLMCVDKTVPGGYWVRVLKKHTHTLPDEEGSVRKAVEASIQRKIQQHERSIAKLRGIDVDQILAGVEAEHRKQKESDR